MYCRECGEAISQDSKFCMHCGADVEIVEEATPIPATPEPTQEPVPRPAPESMDGDAELALSTHRKLMDSVAAEEKAKVSSKRTPAGNTETQRNTKRSIMYWYFVPLRKYAVFSGRAHRTEYWMFTAWNFVVVFLITFIGLLIEFILPVAVIAGIFDIIQVLYVLYAFIPSLAVWVRRLHDTGRSGWWSMIGFIPIVGVIGFFVFALMDSDSGENKYGPNPKLEVS